MRCMASDTDFPRAPLITITSMEGHHRVAGTIFGGMPEMRRPVDLRVGERYEVDDLSYQSAHRL
jgi:hypothetical protein